MTDTVRKVGYQGAPGAYSELAANRHFSDRGEAFECEGFETFEGMLRALKAGGLDYAVLPIENSIAGSINESYDLLAELGLSLVGEEIQPISHCLIGLQGTKVSELERVFSHPVALAQCRRFLATLDGCHVEAFTDTAMSVQKVKEDADPTQAAIASEQAADIYGLPILQREIADHPENYTRMVIVAREKATYPLDVPCKTSLVFSTAHKQGALAGAISHLADRGLNLTKLESRPKPDTPFEYVFYLDFEGNIADPTVVEALAGLGDTTSFINVFGSYPKRL